MHIDQFSRPGCLSRPPWVEDEETECSGSRTTEKNEFNKVVIVCLRLAPLMTWIWRGEYRRKSRVIMKAKYHTRLFPFRDSRSLLLHYRDDCDWTCILSSPMTTRDDSYTSFNRNSFVYFSNIYFSSFLFHLYPNKHRRWRWLHVIWTTGVLHGGLVSTEMNPIQGTIQAPAAKSVQFVFQPMKRNYHNTYI